MFVEGSALIDASAPAKLTLADFLSFLSWAGSSSSSSSESGAPTPSPPNPSVREIVWWLSELRQLGFFQEPVGSFTPLPRNGTVWGNSRSTLFVLPPEYGHPLRPATVPRSRRKLMPMFCNTLSVILDLIQTLPRYGLCGRTIPSVLTNQQTMEYHKTELIALRTHAAILHTASTRDPQLFARILGAVVLMAHSQYEEVLGAERDELLDRARARARAGANGSRGDEWGPMREAQTYHPMLLADLLICFQDQADVPYINVALDCPRADFLSLALKVGGFTPWTPEEIVTLAPLQWYTEHGRYDSAVRNGPPVKVVPRERGLLAGNYTYRLAYAPELTSRGSARLSGADSVYQSVQTDIESLFALCKKRDRASVLAYLAQGISKRTIMTIQYAMAVENLRTLQFSSTFVVSVITDLLFGPFGRNYYYGFLQAGIIRAVFMLFSNVYEAAIASLALARQQCTVDDSADLVYGEFLLSWARPRARAALEALRQDGVDVYEALGLERPPESFFSGLGLENICLLSELRKTGGKPEKSRTPSSPGSDSFSIYNSASFPASSISSTRRLGVTEAELSELADFFQRFDASDPDFADKTWKQPELYYRRPEEQRAVLVSALRIYMRSYEGPYHSRANPLYRSLLCLGAQLLLLRCGATDPAEARLQLCTVLETLKELGDARTPSPRTLPPGHARVVTEHASYITSLITKIIDNHGLTQLQFRYLLSPDELSQLALPIPEKYEEIGCGAHPLTKKGFFTTVVDVATMCSVSDENRVGLHNLVVVMTKCMSPQESPFAIHYKMGRYCARFFFVDRLMEVFSPSVSWMDEYIGAFDVVACALNQSYPTLHALEKISGLTSGTIRMPPAPQNGSTVAGFSSVVEAPDASEASRASQACRIHYLLHARPGTFQGYVETIVRKTIQNRIASTILIRSLHGLVARQVRCARWGSFEDLSAHPLLVAVRQYWFDYPSLMLTMRASFLSSDSVCMVSAFVLMAYDLVDVTGLPLERVLERVLLYPALRVWRLFREGAFNAPVAGAAEAPAGRPHGIAEHLQPLLRRYYRIDVAPIVSGMARRLVESGMTRRQAVAAMERLEEELRGLTLEAALGPEQREGVAPAELERTEMDERTARGRRLRDMEAALPRSLLPWDDPQYFVEEVASRVLCQQADAEEAAAGNSGENAEGSERGIAEDGEYDYEGEVGGGARSVGGSGSANDFDDSSRSRSSSLSGGAEDSDLSGGSDRSDGSEGSESSASSARSSSSASPHRRHHGAAAPAAPAANDFDGLMDDLMDAFVDTPLKTRRAAFSSLTRASLQRGLGAAQAGVYQRYLWVPDPYNTLSLLNVFLRICSGSAADTTSIRSTSLRTKGHTTRFAHLLRDGVFSVLRNHFGPETEAALRAVGSAATFPAGFCSEEG